MKKGSYVNRDELEECFAMTAIMAGLEVLEENQPDDWKVEISEARKHVEKVWEERKTFLDDIEKFKLQRRLNGTKIVAMQKTADFSTTPAQATVNEDDLMDLAATVAENKCIGCKVKEKDCCYAGIFHRLGLPSVNLTGQGTCRYSICTIEGDKK